MANIHLPPEWAIPEREATGEGLYLRRRELVAGMAAAGLLPAAAGAQTNAASLAALPATRTYSLDEPATPLSAVTSYNNFYEFGLDKAEPAANAGTLRPSPWTVRIGGLVDKPLVVDVDKLVREKMEERVYRMRCVEGWSMVIPWVGIPLAGVLKAAGVRPQAKYVAFRTLNDPKQMPGLRLPVLDWPYAEGLRLDEAMNPLSFVAVGLYGRRLPNQNGAPLRLVAPWKYGFKGIKSIVAIDLVDRMPPTSWSRSAPNEYGFYANVNPEVDHPRWSQATERRIGDIRKRRTLMFNGYAPQVAGMYRGMDLAKFY